MEQHLAVEHTHAIGAESSVLWYKVIHHQLVSFEKVIDGCRNGSLIFCYKMLSRIYYNKSPQVDNLFLLETTEINFQLIFEVK